jgi:hypothetical protein
MFNRTWNFVICLGLALLIDVPVFADATPRTVTKIGKATSQMKIDGILDEPAWQTAVPVHVSYIWNKVGQSSREPRMLTRFTWDDHYLYIGYETFDKNLIALGSGESEGPKTNRREGCEIGHPTEKIDVVEFFVSFGDERFFWEFHHNAKNQFNDVWCAVMDDSAPLAKTTRGRYGIYFGKQEFIEDDVEIERRFDRAVKLKPKADGQLSTVNDPSDEDTGYVGELRFPWFGLGGPLASETFEVVKSTDTNTPEKRVHGPWKMAGEQLRILSVFQDGDLKDHYHHSSSTFPGSWFHKGAAHYPRYVLEAQAAQ